MKIYSLWYKKQKNYIIDIIKKINDGGMKIMKNKSKGITLIALVITIIVLLILAGIAIATLTGENGLLSRTESSKAESDKANEKEQINLAIMTAKVNEEGAISKKILKEELDKI